MFYRLTIRRLIRRLARNDPPMGWDRSDRKEWA